MRVDRQKLLLSFLAVLAALALAAKGSAQSPQRLPRGAADAASAVQGSVRDSANRPAPGVRVSVIFDAGARAFATITDAEGIFRLAGLPPGKFTLGVEAGDRSMRLPVMEARARETTVVDVGLDFAIHQPRPDAGRLTPSTPSDSSSDLASVRDIPDGAATRPEPIRRVPPRVIHEDAPDRWSLAEPEWKRYGHDGPYPYAKGRWWDPFNRNRLKGDYPLFGRIFLNLQLLSNTLANFRRLPLPSNISAARPGSEEFFGRGEQLVVTQTFRVTADFFHGDTAFRPFDFRVRFTPAFNVNHLDVRQTGVVNIDVRRGTSRLDMHFGLQEAFVEAKLRNLSRNFDFVSVRAGIQPFSSDFRGFLFVDEQPGLRVFGNLLKNRLEYNAAYFYLLEKDTNSVLNTFRARHQQVAVANLYIQDFFARGYNTQFSVHLNKDEATVHFDENDFLVRPAPIGAVTPHQVQAGYLGWTGNGHIGRLNISHAFYQAFGKDTLNPIAGRRVTINSQMAAVELSMDRDWLRFKGSFLYASGDDDPRDSRARGFDSIVDVPIFAGGPFSLWNSQSIRLTGTGVALVGPNSLFPNLRPNKEEGQANFVNPGLFLYNAGVDVELTPKLRALINVNFLRFDRTESLELLLFQRPIRHTIGVDYSVGFQYRPPLSENMVITFGGAALTPGKGFADIYTRKTLYSIFSDLRLLF